MPPGRNATWWSRTCSKLPRSTTCTWSRAVRLPRSIAAVVSQSGLPASRCTWCSSASQNGSRFQWVGSGRWRRRSAAALAGKAACTYSISPQRLRLGLDEPVKIILSRVEDFEMVRSRHPARIVMKTGAKRDGTLFAREASILLDGGAYADESPAVLSFAVLMARGPYRIAHLRSGGSVVYTNKLKASAFRGFGNPQVTFAGESQIERIAEQLGIHPVELRLRNAVDASDRWVGGQMLPACGLRDCLTKLRSAVETAPPLPPPAQQWRRGIGYSAFSHISGLLSTACNIYLRSDGSVAVNTGVVDIGQGSDTALTQICADALMLAPDRISFASPDSDSSPWNWKTAASRVTYMAGRVVLAASLEVRDKILRQAAEIMECAVEDLEIRPGGLVGLKGVSGQSIGFGQIASHAINPARRPHHGCELAAV